MATPVVSGAAVLLLQQNPSLTPDQVKARLMKAAIGAGYLDVQAALANTDIATLPAISPAEVFNAATNTVSLVTGSTVVWGSNAVWGLNVVWGSSNTQGFNVVWGTGMNGAIDPASVVWGSSTVLDGTAVLIQGEN